MFCIRYLRHRLKLNMHSQLSRLGGAVAISLVVIEVEGYATNVIANVEGAVISRIGLITSQLTLVSLSAMYVKRPSSRLVSFVYTVSIGHFRRQVLS